MKKLTSLLSLLFLFCLNVTSQNLIKNPGFESGTSPTTDRGQIGYADNWTSYYTDNPADLFDVNSTATFRYQYVGPYNKTQTVVGIPINFLTCYNANGYQYSLDSIKLLPPMNGFGTTNNRFAGLEFTNDSTTANGPFTPENLAIVGALRPNNADSDGLQPGICYKIGFWAAAASWLDCWWTTNCTSINNGISYFIHQTG